MIRVNQEGVQGLHVTTLQGDSWGAEERIHQIRDDILFEPMIADAGEALVVAWYDKNEKRGVVREHDGSGWQTEQTLPRGRSFQPKAIAEGQTSALIAGEQLIAAESVSAKKLYRRGEGGTWYCAKLLPNAIGGELHGGGSSFWYLQQVREKLTISSLRVP